MLTKGVGSSLKLGGGDVVECGIRVPLPTGARSGKGAVLPLHKIWIFYNRQLRILANSNALSPGLACMKRQVSGVRWTGYKPYNPGKNLEI